MKVSKANARRVAKAIQNEVAALLVCKAHAEVERERVVAIQREVLADMGQSIEPRDSYRLPDDVANEYFQRLNRIHLADGFAQAADGYCPALVAKREQTKAEWALIEAAERFFPGVTNDRLLCGTDSKGGLETRQEYLDLLVGLVVTAPAS